MSQLGARNNSSSDLREQLLQPGQATSQSFFRDPSPSRPRTSSQSLSQSPGAGDQKYPELPEALSKYKEQYDKQVKLLSDLKSFVAKLPAKEDDKKADEKAAPAADTKHDIKTVAAAPIVTIDAKAEKLTRQDPQFVCKAMIKRSTRFKNALLALCATTFDQKISADEKGAVQTTFTHYISTIFDTWYNGKAKAVADAKGEGAKDALENLYKKLQERLNVACALRYPESSIVLDLGDIEAVMSMQENSAVPVSIEHTILFGEDTKNTKSAENKKEVSLELKSTALTNLTDAQADEYLKLYSGEHGTRIVYPLWLQKQHRFFQDYILNKVNAINDTQQQNVRREVIRQHFGHPPANLRRGPGLSNHFLVEMKFTAQDGKKAFSFRSSRSSFPGPDQHIISENSERIRLIKENIKQVLFGRLLATVKEFCARFNPDAKDVIPIPVLIQSLLSPLGVDVDSNSHVKVGLFDLVKFQRDNNEMMVKTLRQAIIELQQELPDSMMVDGRHCRIKFITTNRPVNNLRNGRENVVRNLNELAVNTDESLQLLNSVVDVLPFIHCNLSDQDNKKECVDFINDIKVLLTNLRSNPKNQNPNYVKGEIDTLLNGMILKINNSEDRNFSLLVQAVSQYCRLIYTKIADENGLNKQLHLAALEEIIILACNGISHGFCKSGQDRKGFELDNVAAMLSHFAVQDTLPEYDLTYNYAFIFSKGQCKYHNIEIATTDQQHRDFIDKFFAPIVASGHNDKVRESEAPGSMVRKEKKHITHPLYVEKYCSDEQLAEEKIVGKFNKPQEAAEPAFAQDEKYHFTDNGRAVSEQRVTHPEDPEAYFMFMGDWLNADIPTKIARYFADKQLKLPDGVKDTNEFMELFGFQHTTPSQKTFLRWISMGKELFELGGQVAVMANFTAAELAEYTAHTQQILAVIAKPASGICASKETYIPNAYFSLLQQKELNIEHALGTMILPSHVSRLAAAYQVFYEKNPQLKKQALGLAGIETYIERCACYECCDCCGGPIPDAVLEKYLKAFHKNFISWQEGEVDYLNPLDGQSSDPLTYRFNNAPKSRADMLFSLFIHSYVENHQDVQLQTVLNTATKVFLKNILGRILLEQPEMHANANAFDAKRDQLTVFHTSLSDPQKRCCYKFRTIARDSVYAQKTFLYLTAFFIVAYLIKAFSREFGGVAEGSRADEIFILLDKIFAIAAAVSIPLGTAVAGTYDHCVRNPRFEREVEATVTNWAGPLQPVVRVEQPREQNDIGLVTVTRESDPPILSK